jgi:hypothetical protein
LAQHCESRRRKAGWNAEFAGHAEENPPSFDPAVDQIRLSAISAISALDFLHCSDNNRASMSLNFLATRFQCTWPWSTLVMLCDGRIVCGCADPYGHRVLGDVRQSSVSGVWTGPVITRLREELNRGGSKFCGDCPLKLPLKKDETPQIRPVDAGSAAVADVYRVHSGLQHLVRASLLRPRDRHHTHSPAGMLDFDLFARVIDEAGPSLGRIDFFNYGEAFLHKRAVEMCEYIKSRFPNIYLYTSTNGLALTERRRAAWSTQESMK